MRFIIAAFLCLFLNLSIHAQSEIETLKKRLEVTPDDTTRVYLLQRFSVIYRFSKPDTSMVLARQSLQLSQQLHFKTGEAMGLNAVGNVFLVTGNYPKALEYYLQALKIYESTNAKSGIGVCLANIAMIYVEEGDYRNALNYNFQTLKIFEDHSDDAKLLLTLLNLGDTYDKMNMPDSALYFTQQGYALAIQINDKDYTGMALTNLGNIHAKMGHRDLAMDYYRLSIPYSMAIDDQYVFGETYLAMAKLFKEKGETDSCLHYAKMALAAGRDISSYKIINNGAAYLADRYEEQNLTDSAYYYFKIASASRDSLFSIDKVKQVQALNFNEQLRQQELVEMREDALKERRNNLQLTGIAIFLLTFFTVIFLLSRKKINPRFIESMGIIGLLLLFEFISVFIHPYLAQLSRHSPVFLLLILVCVSSVLAPIHHYLIKVVKQKLAHKITPDASPGL